jgi:putative redox protein
MNASVTWERGWNFTGTADRGFKLLLGEPNPAGVGEQAFSPMELLLVSLAGCTAIDVIALLEKMQQAVTAFQVRVDGQRAESHPRRFTKINLTYSLEGKGLDPAAVARAIELSQTKYCSATATLTRGVPIHTQYEIR